MQWQNARFVGTSWLLLFFCVGPMVSFIARHPSNEQGGITRFTHKHERKTDGWTKLFLNTTQHNGGARKTQLFRHRNSLAHTFPTKPGFQEITTFNGTKWVDIHIHPDEKKEPPIDEFNQKKKRTTTTIYLIIIITIYCERNGKRTQRRDRYKSVGGLLVDRKRWGGGVFLVDWVADDDIVRKGQGSG